MPSSEAPSRNAPGASRPDPDARPRRGAARRGREAEFHPNTLRLDEHPRSPIRWRVRLVIAALLAAAFAWSYFGRLASYTAAAGKIQPTGRTRIVEAVAIGKVIKISVHDGDVVKAGAVLVELDPTDAAATRAIVAQELTDFRAKNVRLAAVIAAARAATIDPNVKIAWRADVPAAVKAREDGVARADLAKLAAQLATLGSVKREKQAERDRYAKNIKAQKELVAVTRENLSMIERLVRSGYNPQSKYLDVKAQLDGQQLTQTSYEGGLENAEQAILTVDSEIAKTREAFVTAATQAIAANEQTIVDLVQKVVKADQVLANMKVTAPAGGVIHASAVTTIGQVVKPRQQLMQVVPRDAPIEIMAYVSNTDIGFIRKGDPATIKVTAFTYGTYGAIDGTVTDIANDALAIKRKATAQASALDGNYRPSSAAQKTGSIQFPILVRAARSTMRVEGKEIPLVPGMSVNVEILTENRRAIDYIVSPLLELFSTAGHEHP